MQCPFVSKLYAIETFTSDQTSVYYLVYQCFYKYY
jgi:hypothetical protein